MSRQALCAVRGFWPLSGVDRNWQGFSYSARAHARWQRQR